MEFDLAAMEPDAAYRLLVQAVVPRPVAWTLTDSGATLNLAPFSFFNAVCEEPPLVALGLGPKRSGEPADTLVNLRARPLATIHVATAELAQTIVASSATRPHGDSEVELLGLELADFPGHELPRLAAAPVALAARVEHLVDVGDDGRAGVVLLRVERIHAEERVVARDRPSGPRIDPLALDPLARLGGIGYARLGETLELRRPD